MNKTWGIAAVLMLVMCVVPGPVRTLAQDADEPATLPEGAQLEETPEEEAGGAGFLQVVVGSGPIGIALWTALLVTSVTGIYLIIDSFVKIRVKQIMPPDFVIRVRESMEQGDLVKAVDFCKEAPGVMSNILMAGFSNVEEGFDVIQDSIATAADLETEKMMQKLTWLSVVGNLAPMLGLLGTVQGMIMAFATLGQGAPDVGELAMNISQALFTTAGGLTIAVPCVAFYYIFRNSANRIVLRMEAITMELIKDLRNVEVVAE